MRAGEAILSLGFWGTLLKLLDNVGRGESAMDVYKFLPHFLIFIGSPVFSACLIFAGFLLLWRFAKQSETVGPSQIVDPYTLQPFIPPLYPALRRAAWTFVVALCLATAVWACYKTPLRSLVFTEPLPAMFHIPPPEIIGHAGNLRSVKQDSPARAPKQQTASHSAVPPNPIATPETHVPPSVQPTPQQQTDDTQIARSVPTNLIPRDPIKAVQAIEQMRDGLTAALENKESITFLVTEADENNGNIIFVSQLLMSVCRKKPRQCWFIGQGDGRDLDRPPVHGTSRRGITVHGPDADILARALSRWFETYNTSALPTELNGYKQQGTKDLFWVDIGPGSPWKL